MMIHFCWHAVHLTDDRGESAVCRDDDYIYPGIKDEIKNKYDIDLVLMAGHTGFNAEEEDADFMNKEFGHRIYGSAYDMTTLSHRHIEKFIAKLVDLNIKYVVLSIVDRENMIRQVVNSSDEGLLGLQCH